MPYYVGLMLIAGLIGEFILTKVENRFKGLSISFAVAMSCHYLGGSVIPFIITRKQQFETVKKLYGQDYAMKMESLRTMPMIIAVAVSVIVVSIIGSSIAKKFFKKHF